jgi:hypothetical protein
LDLGVGLGLGRAGRVAAQGGTQPVIGPQQELLAEALGLADDSFAVDIETDDSEFPHLDLLRTESQAR